MSFRETRHEYLVSVAFERRFAGGCSRGDGRDFWRVLVKQIVSLNCGNSSLTVLLGSWTVCRVLQPIQHPPVRYCTDS